MPNISKTKNIRKKAQKPIKKSIYKTRSYYLVIFLILVLTAIAYSPILNNGFVWDDEPYIITNPLLPEINIKEIFSDHYIGNYHPLTILVYAIEYQFFEQNAKGYHVVNLLLHLINVILVFRLVLILNGKISVALITSLLFGIHPLHVESVAWASQLKDTLYTLFFLTSFIYYLTYLKDRKKIFYILALMFFSLSLLSKAMAVSLPLVLILTDYYKNKKLNFKSIIDKLPFFILAIIFGIIAIYAQQSIGAMQDIQSFTFFQRIAFASYGFSSYIFKLLIPLDLSAYYPYPVNIGNSIPIKYYLYMIFILFLAVCVFYSLRYTKKTFFGIGFFTLTIFLVLQLLPVGNTIMADRYSYLSSIGIFIIVGEGINFLWWKKLKILSLILLSAFTIYLSVVTYNRSKKWENPMTLWSNVIEQYKTVPMAYLNRGKYIKDTGRYDEMLKDFNKAIELKPDYYSAYINRGNVFKMLKQYDEAIKDYNKVIELNPNSYEAYNNMGTVYMREKKYPEAISNLKRAIELKPDYGMAHANLGIVMYNIGKKDSACIEFQNAIKYRFHPAQEHYDKFCK